ncbi:MAG TPA: asparagine synthase (glutamine-hydrolyzing) [Blastocatellia bacterium]|nr:asparagine synthase (glutamine-hydrolyzing) [Blastocatellia bacterium]
MCGICGVVNFDGRPVDRGLVKRMADVIEHRGPDGEGFYFDRHENAGLGARRLAIIDVAAGHQPISNEDGTVSVAYNGEIYNFDELRDQLLAKGHVFRTHCDTEVIVHAYEEWGDACVKRFNGMFAFAIWDDARQRLLLARDRMGVKPLVYLHRGSELLFASEIKSLLEDPTMARSVDADVLIQYLSFFAIPEPHSLFDGVKRVPAGSVLIFERGEVRLEKYWDIDFTESHARSEQAWLEELEALLEDAVRIRLISEVPLGAFLSGGIDSSLVVAMMARASGAIKTCSIEFAPGYSEARYANLVAEKFETDHQAFTFRRDEAWQALPAMVWHHDEPSQSLIQTYFVSKAARQRVTVALSGLGGDELFTGYPSHVAAQAFHYADKLPRWSLRSLRALAAVAKGSRAARAKRFLDAALMTPETRFASRYLHTTNERDRRDVLSPELRESANQSAATEYLMELFAAANSKDFRGRVLYVDQKAYLANELLRTTDSMSMAHSLEVRTPFLDYRVVELAARMPMKMKMRGFTTKYAIRKLAERLLPAEISRRPKSGFNVPLANWITPTSETFVRDLLAPDTLKRRGYFDSSRVARMLEDHFAARANYSDWIMMLLTLEVWHRQFIDRAPAHSRQESAVAAV